MGRKLWSLDALSGTMNLSPDRQQVNQVTTGGSSTDDSTAEFGVWEDG